MLEAPTQCVATFQAFAVEHGLSSEPAANAASRATPAEASGSGLMLPLAVGGIAIVLVALGAGGFVLYNQGKLDGVLGKQPATQSAPAKARPKPPLPKRPAPSAL